MDCPRNVRIEHPDGTTTPIEVKYVGTEPRHVNDDIYIVEIWEATTIVNWNHGDRIEADHLPPVCAIRTHRVGLR